MFKQKQQPSIQQMSKTHRGNSREGKSGTTAQGERGHTAFGMCDTSLAVGPNGKFQLAIHGDAMWHIFSVRFFFFFGGMFGEINIRVPNTSGVRVFPSVFFHRLRCCHQFWRSMLMMVGSEVFQGHLSASVLMEPLQIESAVLLRSIEFM